MSTILFSILAWLASNPMVALFIGAVAGIALLVLVLGIIMGSGQCGTDTFTGVYHPANGKIFYGTRNTYRGSKHIKQN
jgi:hypothetical protein